MPLFLRPPIQALLVLGFLAGNSTPFAGQAPVTEAYRQAYGPGPETEVVHCMGAVSYFPGLGESGREDRLSALPLFSTRPEQAAREAARVVVEGYPVAPRYLEPPRNFPAGSRLTGFEVKDGQAVVEVESAAGTAFSDLTVQALAHTLFQFPAIRSVRLVTPSSEPLEVASPDPALIEPPPPPRLLDVVSTVHPGQSPKEIDILFDRPVSITEFSIRDEEGDPIPGRTYTSMFDMAVVFIPAELSLIQEGLSLKLRWEVQDYVGRVEKGRRTAKLRIFVQE